MFCYVARGAGWQVLLGVRHDDRPPVGMLEFVVRTVRTGIGPAVAFEPADNFPAAALNGYVSRPGEFGIG